MPNPWFDYSQLIIEDLFDYLTSKDRIENANLPSKSFEPNIVKKVLETEIPNRGEKARFYRYLHQENS